MGIAAVCRHLARPSLLSSWRRSGAGGARAAVAARPSRRPPGASAWRALRDGLVTGLANPKLAVFFIALFPQFMPDGVPVLPSALLMAAMVMAFDLVWYSALAYLVARAAAFVEARGGARAASPLPSSSGSACAWPSSGAEASPRARAPGAPRSPRSCRLALPPAGRASSGPGSWRSSSCSASAGACPRPRAIRSRSRARSPRGVVLEGLHERQWGRWAPGGRSSSWLVPISSSVCRWRSCGAAGLPLMTSAASGARGLELALGVDLARRSRSASAWRAMARVPWVPTSLISTVVTTPHGSVLVDDRCRPR
jgi:hypothetical protein